MKYRILTFLIAAILPIALYSQSSRVMPDTASYPYWIQMMQDPSMNFFETQQAFEKYWENRTITRGCGWKPFKRWENYMKDRVSVTGEIPPPDQVMNAYNAYMMNRKSGSSLAGNWISQGPFDLPTDKGYKGLGRVNAIAFHPTNPNIIFIGAPSGGLWVTTTGGNAWTTYTDNLPTLGVSAIVIDPSNPDIIYIGTGDRDAGDAPGVGVMKSTDGGITWNMANTGMGNVVVGEMLIDPSSPSTLYAATLSGIYKSVDGATTWTKTQSGTFKGIVFKPGSVTTLYATASGIFYRSLDAGITWTQSMNGIAGGARGAIGVTPADPNIVYFLQTKSDDSYRGVYKSTNGGVSFTEQSTSPNIMDWSCDGSGSGGQAWYDLAFVVDALNPNIIYSGGVDIWKSTNGGITWQINGHWYGGCGVPAVHADQHVFTINPLNNRIYAGNDGGVYWTDNGGNTWNEISTGLAISQAYKLGQSATVDELVVNGYQDNGTSIFDAGTWIAIGGGDGMECAIDQTDASYRYTTVYYGTINRCIGNYNQGSIAGQNINGITEQGAWVTPFIIDKNDPNTMFIGYKNVWRSTNIKASSLSSVKWVKISAINTPNLSVLEQSSVNSNILFAASGSNLFLSTNAKGESPTWRNISSFLPIQGTIHDIKTSPYEENTVYIIQSNKVFKSTDLALTWTDITGTLPNIHYSSIAYYKNSQEGLYLGSDAGVFYKDNSMTDWIPFNNGMPANARISELEIYYDPSSAAGDRIKAATYGRGMWKSDMYFSSPTAEFTAERTVIPFGCAVGFTDLSLGVPFHWEWTFTGGSPSVSTDKNPSGILYATPGTYPVKLKVSNAAGVDSLIKTGYIHVSDTLKPMVNFAADTRVFCDINQIVQFSDQSEYCPYAWSWQFYPNTVQFVNGSSTTSQNPQVVFQQKGTYSVMLTALNGNGASSAFKQDYIVAGGYLLPFTEDFESGNLESSLWTIDNPDFSVTWALTNVAGNTPGNKAAWMNFFDYPALGGKRDRLITPPLDFSGTTPVFLTFEHAYASRFASYSDSLILYISSDCGGSWQRIFAVGEKGAGTMATAARSTSSFTPQTSDDWCGNGWGTDCYIIDLTSWANIPGIKIAFEGYNRFSNNLYIDNINISSTTGYTLIPAGNSEIVVYPNPTDGAVTIHSVQPVGNFSITVFNQQGKTVYNQSVKSYSNINSVVDLSKLPGGIYMLRITTDKKTFTEKIVIN